MATPREVVETPSKAYPLVALIARSAAFFKLSKYK